MSSCSPLFWRRLQILQPEGMAACSRLDLACPDYNGYYLTLPARCRRSTERVGCSSRCAWGGGSAPLSERVLMWNKIKHHCHTSTSSSFSLHKKGERAEEQSMSTRAEAENTVEEGEEGKGREKMLFQHCVSILSWKSKIDCTNTHGSIWICCLRAGKLEKIMEREKNLR